MSRDSFAAYHPITNYVFFIAVIVMGMFLMHPVFTTAAVVCSFLYYFTIKGTSGIKFFAGMMGLLVVLTAINPLFNSRGSIVLFTYFSRHYTLEALLYGFTLAGMVVATLGWFAAYNAVVSSDKFIYLFGRLAPTISLVLSMILRLIPALKKKTQMVIDARMGIGLAGDNSQSRKEKIRNGTTVLGALTGWALEDGIITADSMKARGYGSSKRTSFAKYRFESRDIACVCIMVLLLAAAIVCAAFGGTKATFMPQLDIAWFGSIFMMAGLICYIALMLVPSFLNIKESIVWKVLRSGIADENENKQKGEDNGIY